MINIPDRKSMKRRLVLARTIFLANHSELLTKDASERAMTHKFAEALQTVFPEWHVDCEYNRDGKMPKRISLPKRPCKNIFPDIIVHRRGRADNLLIIEAKKGGATAKEIAYDRKKLKAYISGNLGYRYALSITFASAAMPSVTLRWHTLLNPSAGPPLANPMR
ncbi:MAG: hypothetical protein ABMA01_14505 [Chthoniobacteraceae bacterium]